MSSAATGNVPWSPPRDDQLTWFPAKENLPLTPSPLEYTVEVNALFFGLTRALESLEFPLTEVRPRLVEGHLYIAVAPSADAEKDMDRRLQRVVDLSLRYTRDIQGSWHQQVRPKIEDYNRWITECVCESQSPNELAEQVRQLRWVRGNQWFNIFRPVVAPTALMQQWASEAGKNKGSDSKESSSAVKAATDAATVTREAIGTVEHGRILLLSALLGVGNHLVQHGSLNESEDIFWLQWMEVRTTLRNGGDVKAIVVKRKSEAAQFGHAIPSTTLGPHLPDDAPRMYLIREIFALLS